MILLCRKEKDINNERYENTRNLNKYLSGDYVKESHKLSLNEKLQNEFILNFRLIKGIDTVKFYQKYHMNVLNFEVVRKQLNQNLLIYENNHLFINPKYLYVSNSILMEYMTDLQKMYIHDIIEKEAKYEG